MVRKAEVKDIIAINNMLKGSTSLLTDRILRQVTDHIDNGLALVLEKDSTIKGVWLSKDFGVYVSLSFFFVDESERKKPSMLQFFSECMSSIPKSKRIFLLSKDTTGFERYVKHIEGDLYEFKGLRWEE